MYSKVLEPVYRRWINILGRLRGALGGMALFLIAALELQKTMAKRRRRKRARMTKSKKGRLMLIR